MCVRQDFGTRAGNRACSSERRIGRTSGRYDVTADKVVTFVAARVGDFRHQTVGRRSGLYWKLVVSPPVLAIEAT